jgi:hypothetical protein
VSAEDDQKEADVHEPLLDRIRELERAVRRWKLVSFALALMVVSLLAIGGTFGLILVLRASDQAEIEVLMDQEMMARQRAEQAAQDLQEMRRQLEQLQKAQKAAEQDP